MATAVRWRDKDKGFVPEVSRGPEGVRGVDYYLTDTADEAEALVATGLPAVNTPWGAGAVAGLLARVFTARYVGGSKPYGVCVVQVSYASASEFSGVTPVHNFKWTEMSPSVGQTLARYDVRFNPSAAPGSQGTLDEPLLNGDGAPRDVGVLDLIVHKFMRPVELTQGFLNNVIALHAQQAVNSDAVTLPPVLGSTVQYTFQPGQCRFRGFTPPGKPVGDDQLFEVLFTIGVAPDHKLRWLREGADGRGEASFISEIYPGMSFAGLW